MKFADIPGLEKEKQKLLAYLKQGRLPHALLLSGPEGSGKLALGLALIQYLQCESPSALDSCGRCPSCHKTSHLIHPDVHISFPTSGTEKLEKPSEEFLQPWRAIVLNNPYLNASMWQEATEKENKLINISAKECRHMLKKLSLTLYEGNKRVLLVWLPEYLGKEGNILLKFIEEPPADSLILLITENKELLLPTILSRCQAMSIPAFTDDDISQMVQTEVKDETLKLTIVRSADGNMLDALRMVQESLFTHHETMIKWLRLCYKGQGEDLIHWAEQYAGQGREIHRQFLKFGLKFMERILEQKIQPGSEDGYSQDEWKAIKGLATQLSIDGIKNIAGLFDDHIYYVERNANPKILFTALSINLKQVLNHQEVKTLNII